MRRECLRLLCGLCIALLSIPGARSTPFVVRALGGMAAHMPRASVCIASAAHLHKPAFLPWQHGVPVSGLLPGGARRFSAAPAVASTEPEFGCGPTFEVINPCLDEGFRTAFSDPEVCRVFLNEVLGLRGREALAQVTLLWPNLLGRHIRDTRMAITIKAQDARGDTFLIGMQNELHPGYLDQARRAHGWFANSLEHLEMMLHVAPESVSERELGGGSPKEFFENLRGMHSVVISNQDTHPPQPGLVNTYEYRHVQDPTRTLGQFPSYITFVTLAHFTKEPEELKTRRDRLLWAFKDNRLAGDRLPHKDIPVPWFKEVPNIPSVIGEGDAVVRGLYKRLRARMRGWIP